MAGGAARWRVNGDMAWGRFGLWLLGAAGIGLMVVLLAFNPFAPTVQVQSVAEAPTEAPTLEPPTPTAVIAAATPTPPPVPTSAPALAAALPSPTPAPPTATPVPPTPTLAPTPTPLPSAGRPLRVLIPRLKINTRVENVGLDRDGAMDVPKRYDTVGWFQLGARPGELGNAVMAGHLDSLIGPAIFYRLKELRPGDDVIVVSDDGRERRFVVRALENYHYDAAPLDRIFGPSQEIGLNLITCTGAFDRRTQNYQQRLVVFTTLAS